MMISSYISPLKRSPFLSFRTRSLVLGGHHPRLRRRGFQGSTLDRVDRDCFRLQREIPELPTGRIFSSTFSHRNSIHHYPDIITLDCRIDLHRTGKRRQPSDSALHSHTYFRTWGRGLTRSTNPHSNGHCGLSLPESPRRDCNRPGIDELWSDSEAK